MDYFDGNLSDVERADVELFLQQNPEIAEQISGFSDMVLLSNEDIVFDKKEELLTVVLPNQDFEQWENTQPKLSKEQIFYPHKQKLLNGGALNEVKLGKRQTSQWTWYAAAACFVFALFVGRWIFETAELEFLQIAVLEVENRELRTAKPSTKLIENEIGHEVSVEQAQHQAVPIETQIIEHTVESELISHPASRTPYLATSQSDSEQVDNIVTHEHLAIASITPITNLSVTPKTTSHLAPRTMSEANSYLVPEILRGERLELAVNDFVITPAKSVIHNVARRFFERRTEVEMLIEEREFPQLFARR